jgi:hypothetical protein
MISRGYSESPPPPTTLVRLVLAIVIAFGTVVGANWAIGRYLDQYGTNLGYRYIAHKWRVLEQLDEPVDWLVLGDSSGSQSFDPAVLEAKTGQTAVNLGTIGNFGLTDDLWMLEEYLARFGPPKRVVLIHVYDVWRRRMDPKLLGRVPRDRASSPETVEKYDIDEEQLEQMWLVRYVRMYAERTSIRKAMELTWHRMTKTEDELDALRKADRSLPEKEPELTSSGLVRMCGELPAALKRDSGGHMKFLKKSRPRISKDNREALTRIAELAVEHGFEVDLVNGPVYERLVAKPEFDKYFSGIVKGLHKLVDAYPPVHIVESVYAAPSAQLQNVDHITCDGAGEYTEWAIERIEAAR